MKFGKELRALIEEILPEWRDNYLCYKTLKKLLNCFPFTVDLENCFLWILHQELEKLNGFYVDKEEDFVIKFEDLKERIDRVKEKMPENGVFTETELHDEKMGILRDFFTIQGEMVVLKNYCSLNFLGLIKILKKHDKRTGRTLRLPFIQFALQQPFFNADSLTMLVRDCELCGTTKCITEEIKSSAMTVGKYSVVTDASPTPGSHRITIRVTSPYGNNYHYADHVDSGSFAFTAAESGYYMACYWAPDHKPPVTLSIEFNWKSGFAAKDWSKVAKKGQVEVMELELKKLFDTVTSIHDEMFSLRESEEEMQALNRSTNSKMATFSFLSLLVCLAVAGTQLWHLKTFFERKKLI